MSRKNPNSDQEVLFQDRVEMDEELKQKVIETSRAHIVQLWEQLKSLVGEDCTTAIFRGAILDKIHDHPALKYIDIDEKGIRLNRIQDNLASLNLVTLRIDLFAFTNSILMLITDLVGDLVAHKISPVVQHFKKQLEEK